MKLNKILMGMLALLGTAGLVQAQTSVEITGATAFRAATLNTIKARFAAGGNYRYGHNGTSFTSSNQAVFEGTFPGVGGTTVVRTSFNGSVEGINALVNAVHASYINPADLTGAFGATPSAQTGMSPSQSVQADIAFSDVSIASTPYSGQASSVAPASAGVGVVVFTMIKGEGGAAALTNITNKQFQALFTAGIEKLSLFTGDPADASSFVFAAGRNDGSGTRTTYMAETGTGITTLVNQYIGRVSGLVTDPSARVTHLQLAGTSGSNFNAGSNISTVWGQNLPGNGGYSSGSSLQTLLGISSASVDVYLDDTADVNGTDNTFGTVDDAAPDFDDEPITLVSFLTVSDSVAAITNGASALTFNGVGITPASPLSAGDQDKIARGQYTAWGNQQMYRRASGLSTDELAVEGSIRTNVPANIGVTGIPSSTMQVTRNVDGGVITSN